MDPKELKENFTGQLEKIQAEIIKLRDALAQRQELALKLQGAIEAMAIQLPPEEGAEDAEGAESAEDFASVTPTEVVE
jgi:hypothetical protein